MTDFEPLLAWYRADARTLPWRQSPEPYRVLVSEFMLQQTRVDVVIPYYNRFLERFPTLESLARADVEEVLPLWSGLGYYRRARSLHAAASRIAELGEFPSLEAELTRLPGVGAYTAAAVSSIAFGRPAVALDGNAIRVLCRLLALRTPGTLRERVLPAIPPGAAAMFTQAVMELGATLCRPRAPLCETCPLKGQCLAHQQGLTDEIPAKSPARPPVHVSLEALRCHKGDRILLERQSAGPLLKGMWMFPYRALNEGGLTSLFESLPVGAAEVRASGQVRHQITFRKITVDVFEARAIEADRVSERELDAGGYRWVHPSELHTMALPSLTRKILESQA